MINKINERNRKRKEREDKENKELQDKLKEKMIKEKYEKETWSLYYKKAKPKISDKATKYMIVGLSIYFVGLIVISLIVVYNA